MMRNTTVDSAMSMSLVSRSWSAALRPGLVASGSAVHGGAYRASSALTFTLTNLANLANATQPTGLECSRAVSRLSGWDHVAMAGAGVGKGGIRPVAADLIEQPFGGALGEMALNGERDQESAFVSKLTYGRSHDPAVRRRRGEG